MKPKDPNDTYPPQPDNRGGQPEETPDTDKSFPECWDCYDHNQLSEVCGQGIHRNTVVWPCTVHTKNRFLCSRCKYESKANKLCILGYIQPRMDYCAGFKKRGPNEVPVTSANNNNVVKYPKHYILDSGIECKNVVCEIFGADGYLAQAFQYLWRCGYKGNKRQDVEKAAECLKIWLDNGTKV